MPTANKAARTLRDDEVDIRDFLRCERSLADYRVDLGYELPVIARKGPFLERVGDRFRRILQVCEDQAFVAVHRVKRL